jgi:hypothetical protein
VNTYSARHNIRATIADALDNIEETEDLNLKLRGMLGVRGTLVDFIYDIDLDIGELVALIEINKQQGN